MPWLISLIGNLAGMLGIQLAKKTTFITAIILASTALMVALGAVINSALSAIAVSMPSAVAAGSIFLPTNTSACITAIISCKTARMLYDWNMKNLEMSSNVN